MDVKLFNVGPEYKFRLKTMMRTFFKPCYWKRRINSRRAVLPKVFLISVPKAGTNLLLRCLSLFPNFASNNIQVGQSLALPMIRQLLRTPAEYPIEKPLPACLARLDWACSLIGPGEYETAHLVYHPLVAHLLKKRGFRGLFILRDPRDTVISMMFHILSHPEEHRHPVIRKLKTEEGRLMACIRGVPGLPESGGFYDIGKWFQSYSPWAREALNYTTRFERLIGPQGGGSAEAQREEIGNIARHLGIFLSSKELESIASGTFWPGSLTFREGQIGSWKRHFKEEHKTAFKRVAGQLLIELGYEKDMDW